LLDFVGKNDIEIYIDFIHFLSKLMKLTTIAHIFGDHKQFLDQDIILNGRVRSVRDSKTFGFIELND